MTVRRSFAIAGAAAASSGVFVFFVNRVYPLRTWLMWTVLQLWAWQVLLVAALVACGNLLLERVLHTRPARRSERLTLAAALGAVVFGLGMFVAGLAACLGPIWAVIWPTVLLLAGVVGGRDSLRELVAPSAIPYGPRASAGQELAARATLMFGTFCLGLIYLGIFSPDSVSYDAEWTHLAIAQDYAREGRIVAFDADWTKTLAHFGSVINTWAFLVPGLAPAPVRWMMALHIEFAFFCLTLVGVTAGVQWATRRSAPHAWLTLFLLPGIFVYDGNLGGAADHFAAFFAAPAFLAAAYAADTGNPRCWALFGIFAGAAVMTKYQAVYFLAPAAAMMAVAWMREARRRVHAARAGNGRPGGKNLPGSALGSAVPLLLGPALMAGAIAVVSSPHFLWNWVVHGNPVYPFAQRLFHHSMPSIPDAATMAENIISHFGTRPPAEWTQRFLQALRLSFDFSLRPHAGFTGKVPVIGSLFSLCMPVVLFLPRARRIRLVVALGWAALLLWGWTYRVDRNLQSFLPLLAIGAGAVLARAWEAGVVARAAAVLLVAVQLMWSADHFFLGSERIITAIGFIRSGFDGRAATRFDAYGGDRVALGRSLQPDAKVVLHDDQVSLGIDRPVLLDWLGFQGLIDSRTFKSPRDLYDRFHALGVTHVVFRPGLHAAPTRQDEVIFAAFADRYREATATFGALRLLPMPTAPPPPHAEYSVLVIGVDGTPDGVYDVTGLSTMREMPVSLQKPATPKTAVGLDGAARYLASADAAMLGVSAKTLQDDPTLKSRFRLAAEYPDFSVWVPPP